LDLSGIPQYFSFCQVPWENHLPMAVFFMQGDALSWFKWMYHNNQLTDWFSFLRALEPYFGPSSDENHQVELFKLHNYGSIF